MKDIKEILASDRFIEDSKALKKDLPDVYEKYAKVGKPSMRFTLK